MPIPSAASAFRTSADGFSARDLAGLALLCARYWGARREDVLERLERADWDEAERRLSMGRPASLDLGAVDLAKSRTFRTELAGSLLQAFPSVPGRLLCGVRPLSDGRFEAAMSAGPENSFLNLHPACRGAGAVTLAACGSPGVVVPALRRRLSLDLGPLQAAPPKALPALPSWCSEEGFARAASLFLSAAAEEGQPLLIGRAADRLARLRENGMDGIFQTCAVRVPAGEFPGLGTGTAEVRLAAAYDPGLDELVWRAAALSAGKCLVLGTVRAELAAQSVRSAGPAAPAALLMKQACAHLAGGDSLQSLRRRTIIACGTGPAAGRTEAVFLRGGSVHVVFRDTPGPGSAAELSFGLRGPALFEAEGARPAAVPFQREDPSALANLIAGAVSGRFLPERAPEAIPSRGTYAVPPSPWPEARSAAMV